ncbi:MAG: ATP-binding protein [Clostridia bacterium]|nr:ATP-binding protein [Clostridia bacterium]
MLNRDYYISKFDSISDTNVIKVLVGLRGTGKSTIFSQIITNLKTNKLADDFHIININLDFIENEKFKDKISLEHFIDKKINDKKIYYLFIDEIQYITRFEDFLEIIINKYSNISIFISSSTSRLLKKDLRSIFSKKYKIIYVTPLTYIESCSLLNTIPNNKTMLLNYLKYGGLPERFSCKKSSEVKKVLYSTMDSIFLRDIVLRLGLNNIEDLYKILKFIIKYLGTDTSILSLKREIVDVEKLMPEHRFYDAIDSLLRSLIIQPADGYDISSDKSLNGTCRYYLSDLGIAFLYGFDINNNMDAIIKNWLWLELKRRGYSLYTGINNGTVIDFVAIKNKRTMYIQVVNELSDGNTINKEIEKFRNIDALNPRYLLSLDNADYSRKGVIHKNIINFLIKELDKIENDDTLPNWVCVE